MPPSIGDIFRVRVRYADDPTQFKDRPVVILAISDDRVTAITAQLTSQDPGDPPSYYDQFKFPVTNWRASGLDQASWVKTAPENLIELKLSSLRSYIGRMHPQDLDKLFVFIENHTTQ